MVWHLGLNFKDTHVISMWCDVVCLWFATCL